MYGRWRLCRTLTRGAFEPVSRLVVRFKERAVDERTGDPENKNPSGGAITEGKAWAPRGVAWLSRRRFAGVAENLDGGLGRWKFLVVFEDCLLSQRLLENCVVVRR